MEASKRLMILSRGTVALSPAFLRSFGVVMGGRRGQGTTCRGQRGAVIIALRSLFSKKRAHLHSRRRPAAARFGGAVGLARAPASALAAALLAGCTPFDTFMPAIEQFGIYKLDINQGNYLSQDQVDKLKVGQTTQQVRSILGTPLITSPFRDNRWDYVYEFKRRDARASTASSPSISTTTRWPAGKATRCRNRRRSSTASRRPDQPPTPTARPTWADHRLFW